MNKPAYIIDVDSDEDQDLENSVVIIHDSAGSLMSPPASPLPPLIEPQTLHEPVEIPHAIRLAVDVIQQEIRQGFERYFKIT